MPEIPGVPGDAAGLRAASWSPARQAREGRHGIGSLDALARARAREGNPWIPDAT
ncbi:MAG: hypothetical protein ABSA02_03855 [Trebonia sp.]